MCAPTVPRAGDHRGREGGRGEGDHQSHRGGVAPPTLHPAGGRRRWPLEHNAR